MATISAHLVVHDAAHAARWYAMAFGARERGRIPLPSGKLVSVELWIGDSEVRIADEFPELGIVSPRALGGTYGALQISTDDVDALWQRALDAGAEVFHPLADSFWGTRHGQVIDPFGHRWGLSQHLRDVPADELIRAAAEAFSSARG
ncbi:VOC family protein [Pseudonocardia acaciae]|uniref:VOC family protein n=1 Tax=Pseudonocardia acaciae TaxID=551276 RepID=UPI00048B0A0A|nr:VOC family protein [Pseudonocardia acaciae]